jgi:Domain of unknown function (DUF397)
MANPELYEQELTGPFASLCGGGTNDGNMEDCVLVAPIEGGGLALRDTKLADDSPELRFSAGELRALGDKIAELTN